jgi:hypothetical protein
LHRCRLRGSLFVVVVGLHSFKWYNNIVVRETPP